MSNERVTDNPITYDSPGPSYKHAVYPPDPPKEWVGLTDENIRALCWMDNMSFEEGVELIRAAETKLKQKNSSDSAIDTELKRLGYPL